MLAMPAPAIAQHWARSWAAAPQVPLDDRPIPDLSNSTIEQVVRLSRGGTQIRLRISNEMSKSPLRIDRVDVAQLDIAGLAIPGSRRTVRFSAQEQLWLPAYAPMISDPVPIPVGRLSRLLIRIHLQDGSAEPTVHVNAAATTRIVRDSKPAEPIAIEQRLFLTGVDVSSATPLRTIVAFGDSITDTSNTKDADTRWPDALAKRLTGKKRQQVSIANEGIAGTRVLTNRFNALERFDRDVLSIPGVSHVILLEGINDIRGAWRENRSDQFSAETLIVGYKQIIARAHDKGIRVILGTILPYKGERYWNEWGENVRQNVNTWIRTTRETDGFIDFDKTLRDPADLTRLAPRYDSGDKLHPSDAGLAAMAAAIDLRLLQ